MPELSSSSHTPVTFLAPSTSFTGCGPCVGELMRRSVLILRGIPTSSKKPKRWPAVSSLCINLSSTAPRSQSIFVTSWATHVGSRCFREIPRGHEWRGSGTMLLAHSINQACQMGVDELGLGTGDQQYKDLWTDEVRILCEIRSAVPGFASRAMVQTESLARRARAAFPKPRIGSEAPLALTIA